MNRPECDKMLVNVPFHDIFIPVVRRSFKLFELLRNNHTLAPNGTTIYFITPLTVGI